MKLLLLLFVCSFFYINTSAQQQMIARHNGLYAYGKNIEKGGIGNLIIRGESDTTLLFHLEVNRGAPSYNSGETYGRMHLYKDSGVYRFSDTSGIYDCGLIFLFSRNKITIRYSQDSVIYTECGYGFGVYAAGTYFLRARKNITSFKDRSETDIPFNSKTIDDWEKHLY